jgi:hypothetical protein
LVFAKGIIEPISQGHRVIHFYNLCDIIPGINNLKEEGFLLAHNFRDVSHHGSVRSRADREQGPGITFKDMPPVTYFLH